ncbi:MAG TPA: TAXI family TRAP transporter solute-binding subunit, partial [Pseudonocardiaceae bacterium]|nr:TAXI family TRAP transporter solute-binding subunit [Pseudonocardiaceae bacterium]
RTVSVGEADSQTQLVANRLLSAAGVRVVPVDDSLAASIVAMRNGGIDAFVWSGGVPTDSIAKLDRSVRVRLLDLGTDPSGVLRTVQREFPVYGTAVVPAGTYQPGSEAVTTLVVPNFLLVTDLMSDDVAEALVRGLFDSTNQLVVVNTAALAIDIHTAIYTEPVPLHPGAMDYYRSAKS